MENIVEVKDLVFSFDGKEDAINGVSFVIPKGSYVSLIGHNGSGKSTLARLLIGLLTAKSGSITMFGKELNEKNLREIRSKVGIVFQNPDNQFIGSTVRDDIAFGLENRMVNPKEMDKIIEEYSENVGMKEFLDKEPLYLSGGQKQRVAIAGILALNPDLIIFDEATAMLDPKGKAAISKIIAETRAKHPDLTIISITHDFEEAYQGDVVIVLDKGKIIIEGPSKEVFSNKEILEKYKIGRPFIFKFKDELRANDIDFKDSDNLEEIINSICQ